MMKPSFLIGYNNLKRLTFKGEVELTTNHKAQTTEHRSQSPTGSNSVTNVLQIPALLDLIVLSTDSFFTRSQLAVVNCQFRQSITNTNREYFYSSIRREDNLSFYDLTYHMPTQKDIEKKYKSYTYQTPESYLVEYNNNKNPYDNVKSSSFTLAGENNIFLHGTKLSAVLTSIKLSKGQLTPGIKSRKLGIKYFTGEQACPKDERYRGGSPVNTKYVSAMPLKSKDSFSVCKNYAERIPSLITSTLDIPTVIIGEAMQIKLQPFKELSQTKIDKMNESQKLKRMLGGNIDRTTSMSEEVADQIFETGILEEIGFPEIEKEIESQIKYKIKVKSNFKGEYGLKRLNIRILAVPEKYCKEVKRDLWAINRDVVVLSMPIVEEICLSSKKASDKLSELKQHYSCCE